MKSAEFFGRLAAILFPCRCVLCGNATAYDDMWCGKCEAGRLDAFETQYLPHGLNGAVSALEYGGTAQSAILKIKKTDDSRTFRFFAEEMKRALEAGLPDIHFDVAVPVPLNSEKHQERGFNHAERLASALGTITGIPVAAHAMSRSSDSREQHSLSPAERRVNAERAYSVACPEAVEGKIVLLVDDVQTTGATLSACAKKLKVEGALQVYSVTATKTLLETGSDCRE